MEHTIGTTELRRRLTDVLNAVREQHATYVVETFDRPLAVLINVEEYQQFQRIRDRHQAPRSVEEVQAFVDALYGDKKPGTVGEDLIADRRRENATS